MNGDCRVVLAGTPYNGSGDFIDSFTSCPPQRVPNIAAGIKYLVPIIGSLVAA